MYEDSRRLYSRLYHYYEKTEAAVKQKTACA